MVNVVIPQALYDDIKNNINSGVFPENSVDDVIINSVKKLIEKNY